jgi:hypothetical protein
MSSFSTDETKLQKLLRRVRVPGASCLRQRPDLTGEIDQITNRRWLLTASLAA